MRLFFERKKFDTELLDKRLLEKKIKDKKGTLFAESFFENLHHSFIQ
jgi:hypothetical protein